MIKYFIETSLTLVMFSSRINAGLVVNKAQLEREKIFACPWLNYIPTELHTFKIVSTNIFILGYHYRTRITFSMN